MNILETKVEVNASVCRLRKKKSKATPSEEDKGLMVRRESCYN